MKQRPLFLLRYLFFMLTTLFSASSFPNLKALSLILISLLLLTTTRPAFSVDYVEIAFPKNEILDSKDQPVGSNRTYWVGTFTNNVPGDKDISFVMNLARSNTNGLGVVNSWSNRFARLVQTNFLGRDLILTNRPTTAMTNRPVYVWMFNNTNPSQATEMILWRSQNPEYFDRNTSLESPVTVSLSPPDPLGLGSAVVNGSATLFGQYLPQAGCWRMSPIKTNADNRTKIEQISLSAVDWFVGDANAALDLPANNGPTAFSVMVTNTNTGATSSLSSIGLSYSNGRISGLLTVTNTNQHVLWLTATNSNNLTATASGTLTLRVRNQTGPSLTNATGFSAVTGSDFAGFQLGAQSTNLPLTFTCLNGSELAGLSLSSSGMFSGTTFNTDTRTLRIQVEDSAGNVRRSTLSFSGTPPSLLINAVNSDGILEVPYGTQTNFPVNYSPGFDDGALELEISDTLGDGTATFDNNNLAVQSTRPPTRKSESPEVNLSAIRIVNSIPPVAVAVTTTIPVRVLAPRPTLSLSSPVSLYVGQETQIDVSTGSTYADGSSTFRVSNIPAGLSYESATKRILGTNSSTNQSRWSTTVTADNSSEYYGGGPSDPATIIFNITNRFPLFASANSSILAGINRTFSAAFTISNLPTHSEVTNLPAGITNRGISYSGNRATLTLSGYPTESVVARPLTLKVWNYKEPGKPDPVDLQEAIFPITLYVSDSRPRTVSYSSPDNLVLGKTIQEPFTDTNRNGVWDDAEPFTDTDRDGDWDTAEPFTDTDGNGVWDDAEPFTDTNGNNKHDLVSPFIDVSSGVWVSAYGLPPGLSLDSSTGYLSGTPTSSGTYSATVFVQNGKGWTKKTVVLNVR